MLIHFYLQVCDIIHNSPAFDTMPLNVNEVVVDLRIHKDKEVNTEYRKKTSKGNKEWGTYTVENQRCGLSEGKCCHEPVDLKHAVPVNKIVGNIYFTGERVSY